LGKRLGQHFLKDPTILKRIVDGLKPAPEDVVLEVGTGEGDLTKHIAERVGEVISIEADPLLYQRLKMRNLKENIKLVEGDALKVDWHEVINNRPFKVIGNIPYYITSPLIEKALLPPRPATVVFLMQAEVASRLAASPGSKEFGAITVGVTAVARVEKLFGVKPGAFVVPPRVDSAVVRLTPIENPLVAETERQGFRRFVNALFSKRRKQIRGILREYAGTGAEKAEEVLESVGVQPTVRPETLEVVQFVELFRKIHESR
jgi:16S rRNA (adenine1518-N6/adenine1519-N6)-dimethyltransferase